MGAEWSILPRVVLNVSIAQKRDIVEFLFVKTVFRKEHMLSDRLDNKLRIVQAGRFFRVCYSFVHSFTGCCQAWVSETQSL